MIALTAAEVAAACGGTLRGLDGGVSITDVVVDSRRARPGCLFVPMAGERTDGHRFIDDVRAAGAAGVLVTSEVDAPSIVVSDQVGAMRDIAVAVRQRVSATVIAVTGSSGKTGTKDLIAAACATERRTVASAASFNNEIGVPLTVFSADEATEVLVVEVGSRGIGHIAALAPAVRPNVSVVTNVGPAHLGMFGSLDGTEKAKGELVEALDPSGVAVLNADDPRVRAMGERAPGRVVTFGRSADADVRAADVVLDGHARPSFTLIAPAGQARVSLRMIGEHMVSNALAAAAAAGEAGVSVDAIARGLSAADASAWRMEIREGARGVTIVNDSYNANPDSMAAALRALRTMASGRPTWAVLGYMAELGDDEVAEHDRIGRLAVRLGVGHVVTVGTKALALHEAARLEGMPPDEAMLVETVEDAIALLRERVEDGAVVLVKASRAAGLERVAAALEAGA